MYALYWKPLFTYPKHDKIMKKSWFYVKDYSWNYLWNAWFYVKIIHKIIYKRKIMILCNETRITTFMKEYDFVWNLWYDMTSMYVISFEIYEMTSMQVWFDKICNGLCYDMKTVPMLWAYCIARSCMLVVHPVLSSLCMDSTTRGHGRNRNLFRFANPNSRGSTVGNGLW